MVQKLFTATILLESKLATPMDRQTLHRSVDSCVLDFLLLQAIILAYFAEFVQDLVCQRARARVAKKERRRRCRGSNLHGWILAGTR